jgi:hypothetical protein
MNNGSFGVWFSAFPLDENFGVWILFCLEWLPLPMVDIVVVSPTVIVAF